MTHKKVRVLIVDDSALIRLLLSQILSSDDDIEVVGTATDPYDARDKIKRYHPDVLTLDVEMPKMDGLTFLENLMRLRPMPVVMISTLTEKGADVTLRALELGAFDYITKPSVDVKETLELYAETIRATVKAAATANVQIEHDAPTSRPTARQDKRGYKLELIAIGASTGGTEAIKDLLLQLPDDLPPIVMAQHIPDVFSTSYARRLDQTVGFPVVEVRGPTALAPGHAYLAPGDDHMFIERKGKQLFANIHKGEPVNRHRPSVDVLFESVAHVVGKAAAGVILTGMGADGAKGLLAMREKGALTLAQDEASCVVWGMPRAAFECGATEKVLPLKKIGQALLSVVYA